MLRINTVNLLVLAFVFIIAAFPRGLKAEVITLGFIGPLTGEVAAFGNDEKNAVIMAIEDINRANVLQGKTLRAVFEDGKCSGKDAATAASKLIAMDKVKVILGGVCSGETLGAAPVAERSKVILFSAVSSNPAIAASGDFVFRLAPDDRQAARKAAASMLSQKPASIGLITETNDYALGYRAELVSRIRKAGLEITADEYVNPDENDFASLITRMESKHLSLLAINVQSGVKAGLIMKQIRRLHWEGSIYGTYAFSTPDAIRAAGGIKNMESVRFPDLPALKSEQGKNLLRRFEARYPAPQTELEVLLRYESVLLVAEAISEVGEEPGRIREYFNEMPEYHGLEFSFHFDANGDAVGIPYVMKTVRDGTIREEE